MATPTVSSFYSAALQVGIVCGAGLQFDVYIKGKKYRHGMEYGNTR